MSNIGGRKMSKSKSEESGYDSDTTRKSGTSSQVQYWAVIGPNYGNSELWLVLTMTILTSDWLQRSQSSPRGSVKSDGCDSFDSTEDTGELWLVSIGQLTAILISDWSRLCSLGGQVRDCSCRGLGEIQVGGFILFQCGKYIILQITFYISFIYIC